ncbi:3-deoxy-7-phosphoheptulonate synthase [Kibdelosporangium banguiense]|uniref:Phospho-2-dehydro-3-deoxyheptonate aldolase n=1 Tax=Kibdelosporangium banguiense TaxID=1365924 RepID=A0ABS4TKP4_9PSEU|nr:3-deoxy-7-phosphoheptulonate synthase [Kibdelosporangium banguiense]MBP2324997.1 3-deoxy-7-phosphoheptulonate synthase [Kibdelosporangium banguiense]
MSNLNPAVEAKLQPPWDDPQHVRDVRHQLGASPPLVTLADVELLRRDLAQVAAGRAKVIQAGDCAEDPADANATGVARRVGLIEMLAGVLRMIARRPVVATGRMAGQFGKPRSKPTQQVGDRELPVYRGHMVNGPEPDLRARRPDPDRLITGYDAARRVMAHLGWTDRPTPLAGDLPVWTSHEALLLDYEIPMVREQDDGRLLLTSTHWPWIGERTRHADGAHMDLLAKVLNPVACKVGPTATPEEVLAICARLDPAQEPGRLTLIARMGADAVGDVLPPLAAAVREAGYPVIWLCDPMHANTTVSPEGLKTRFVDTIVEETAAFQEAVSRAGAVAGGLHLETATEDVTECVACETDVGQVGDKYTSLCDPRLNPGQALRVVSAWTG